MNKAENRYDLIATVIVVFSLLIWLFTESLSLFHALTTRKVILLWGILLIGVLGCYGLKCRKTMILAPEAIRKKSCFGNRWKDWTSLEVFLLLMAILLSGIMFLLSYRIVPNNWDSMTYHLPRVMNWIENGSATYYPTNNPRQLYYSNFSEYVILHIMLIFQNDQMVNLVQWFAYAASGYMLYRIVRKLELKRIYALLAALLYMLCPLAIAESVTTQVDLVGTMWCLIFAYFALKIGKSSAPLNSRDNLIGVAFCAASIGLGYLTKSSVCFVMPFILVWLLIACVIKKEKIGNIIICIALAGAVILALALPGFIRNYNAFGSIIPTSEMGRLMIDWSYDPFVYVLNTLKNLTIQTVGMEDCSGLWNFTMWLAMTLGYDIEDSRISAYPGFAEGRACSKSFHHDTAGAQMLLILAGVAVVAGIILFMIKIIKKERWSNLREDMFVIFAAIGAASLFVCIRWQPWGNRLMLPALPFLSLFIVYVLSKWKINKKLVVVLVSVSLILMMPDAYQSVRKQVVDYMEPQFEGKDRFELYFLNRYQMEEPYRAIVERISEADPHSIGLLLGGDDYEYPLWAALKTKENVMHPVVLGEEQAVWEPQIIIAVSQGQMKVADEITFGDNVYQCVWYYGDDVDCAILVLQ